MPLWLWLLSACTLAAALWLAATAILALSGRRTDARALAAFVPDCAILLTRLLRDERLPRRRKLLLAGLVAYLAFPFDLIPDVLPGVGQIDDLVAVALVARSIIKGGGEQLIREHWPGPDRSLNVLLRVAGVAAVDQSTTPSLSRRPHKGTHGLAELPVEASELRQPTKQTGAKASA
jgi:uncharacterized membrane protein YkvA (DUF1232 family)